MHSNIGWYWLISFCATYVCVFCVFCHLISPKQCLNAMFETKELIFSLFSSSIKIFFSNKYLKIHLLQDKRLCAHNNSSTLILHELNTLKMKVETQKYILAQIWEIKPCQKPSIDFIEIGNFLLFSPWSASSCSFCHHSESGQVYTPLKMDLLSSLTNRMKIALMPMSIVEALVQIFVEVAMSILQLVVQLFTVFLSCSF